MFVSPLNSFDAFLNWKVFAAFWNWMVAEISFFLN